MLSPRGKKEKTEKINIPMDEDDLFYLINDEFSQLPDEVILMILLFLRKPIDILNFGLVCKRFHRLSEENIIWHNLCVRLHCCKGTLDTITTRYKDHFLYIKHKIREYGCTLQTQNRNGDTPLHREIKRTTAQDKDIIMMIEHGVDVNMNNKEGATPLFLSVGRGRGSEVVLCLVRNGANLEKLNKYGDAALHLAAIQGSENTMQTLLDAGANISVRNKDGDTPLHRAARFGQLSTVIWLCDHGADLAEKNENGFTALHYATYNGHLFTVRWMVEQGIYINVKNNFGDSPMHEASAQGDQATVHWLWQHGADISARNNSNSTPLHRAASNGHQKTVEWLVEHGADINARNNIGETPIHSAIKLRHYSTVGFFINYMQPSKCNNKQDKEKKSTELLPHPNYLIVNS